MADYIIYSCDLCTEKFQTLDDLREHKSKVHSYTLQDNLTIIPGINQYSYSNNIVPSFPTDNHEVLIENNISEIETNKNLNSNNEKIEKPISSEPLLAQDVNIITQQPVQNLNRENDSECCRDACDCCYILCRCFAEAPHTANNSNCCGNDDGCCGDCDCGDCACGDCDCGGCDCDCGGCDCSGCDCGGCDCSIM